jgi:hypothetical protein
VQLKFRGCRLEVAGRAFLGGVVLALRRVTGEAEGPIRYELGDDLGKVARVARLVGVDGGRVRDARLRTDLIVTRRAGPAGRVMIVVTRRAAQRLGAWGKGNRRGMTIHAF